MCNSSAPAGAVQGAMLERLTGRQGTHSSSTHADFSIQAASFAADCNSFPFTKASLNNLTGRRRVSGQGSQRVTQTAKSTSTAACPYICGTVPTAASGRCDLRTIFRLPSKSYSPLGLSRRVIPMLLLYSCSSAVS